MLDSDKHQEPTVTNVPPLGIVKPTALVNRAELDALSDAIRAVTGDLSLDRVLRRLAEIAATLVNARYAALGVPDSKGNLKNFFTYGMTEAQMAAMDHLPHGHGLLGTLLIETEPVRLVDMSKDPRSSGFGAHHPHMTSFLGVPIISKGQHLGSLYLSDRVDGKPFDEEDERLIALLAGHAAVAIENARLSEQLRRLAVVEERDRIAMELHDGIIQSIYAIGLKLELVRTVEPLGPALNGQLLNATQGLNRVIEDLRRYIQDLKRGVDYSVTLQNELTEIADSFRSISTASLVMDVAPGFTHLNDDRLHTIIQVVRETLSNVTRHADATEVYMDLNESLTQITLSISDNGSGFDPNANTNGNGLRNMRRRAERIDGEIEIISDPGHGSTLTLRLPLQKH